MTKATASIELLRFAQLDRAKPPTEATVSGRFMQRATAEAAELTLIERFGSDSALLEATAFRTWTVRYLVDRGDPGTEDNQVQAIRILRQAGSFDVVMERVYVSAISKALAKLEGAG